MLQELIINQMQNINLFQLKLGINQLYDVFLPSRFQTSYLFPGVKLFNLSAVHLTLLYKKDAFVSICYNSYM